MQGILSSTEPPDCKFNESYSVALGYFLKMRQIQNGGFFAGASIGKNFNIIKYNQIIYCWLANFMLINFYEGTVT